MDLIFGSVEGVFRLLMLAMVLVKVYALVDAAIRPEAVWRAAVEQRRVVWLAILAAAAVTGLFSAIGLLGLAGLVAALVYLLDVRPKLREVQGRGRTR